jgi:hypothetical protein
MMSEGISSLNVDMKTPLALIHPMLKSWAICTLSDPQ